MTRRSRCRFWAGYARGYTMQGGNQRANVEAIYANVGRERDQRAVNRWQSC